MEAGTDRVLTNEPIFIDNRLPSASVHRTREIGPQLAYYRRGDPPGKRLRSRSAC